LNTEEASVLLEAPKYQVEVGSPVESRTGMGVEPAIIIRGAAIESTGKASPKEVIGLWLGSYPNTTTSSFLLGVSATGKRAKLSADRMAEPSLFAFA
jgi:hypothetical protein